MSRIDKISFALALIATGAPAVAGTPGAPAPVAGIGIGAVLLMGVGYRALKNRIKR